MKNKKLIIVDKLELDNYKTKEAEKFLSILPTKEVKTLLILARQEENKKKITRSFRNLPYVVVSDSNSINPSQILSPHYLIFTHSAFSEVEGRLN
jgi:ribosomal protein L4